MCQAVRVAGVVAAITAILGVPVAFLQIRKTIAEIRKTELEAKKLQEQTGGELPTNHEGHRIYLSDSDYNVIQILADPRFAAPLLSLARFRDRLHSFSPCRICGWSFLVGANWANHLNRYSSSSASTIVHRSFAFAKCFAISLE